jgi:hypothetical protein
MIAIECPQCAHKMDVPDDLAGKQAKCSKCLHDFPVDGARSVVIAAPIAKLEKTRFFEFNAAEAEASGRYPVLALYLCFFRIVSTIFGGGGAIIGCVLFIFGFLGSVPPLVLPGIGLVVVGGMEFVVALAFIQFVYVVLDIEQNTRTIAQREVQTPPN